jgi:acetoacetyl-CoA synthetase
MRRWQRCGPCALMGDTTARDDAATAAFEPLWLPFDHPLWIVYSSGTTGLPKPIVHGHGGTVVVALALKTLHNDVGCSYAPNTLGERFHWYSSTGWVMWNAQMSGLLNGTTCCIYDGNPGRQQGQRPTGPRCGALARTGRHLLRRGRGVLCQLHEGGCGPDGPAGPEDRARAGHHGLAPERRGAELGHAAVRRAGPSKTSGGATSLAAPTFAGAFIGGNRELPLVPGEMQCRLLGCAVEAWNEQGQPVVNEVGELVCTKPIPSMPLYFWGDEGNKRYLSSYFDMYPGVWRHGDWLKIGHNGGCIIYGRSDATINRHGLRMGTSELYSAVEALPEVLDSMVVDLEYLGRESYMPLFVVLREASRWTTPCVSA